MSDKNLIDTLKLKPKIICWLIGLGIVYGVTSKAGFPMLFIKVFMFITTLCFLFFVMLDVPDMKPQTPISGTRNLLITFILGTCMIMGAGFVHPQFDPAFEIAKINRPPLKELPTGPEAIEAGYGVFQDNKCTNCHKTSRGGSSDRGPHLFNMQIGAYPIEWIKEQIVKPRKQQHPGFDDPKSKKAMPTYYGEDLDEMSMDLLIVFLQTQVNDKEMPKVGRVGEYKTLREYGEQFLADGKKMFEGELNEDINCSVCHGKDGVPLMSDAADLRKKGHVSKNYNKPLSEMTDAEWFFSVWNGVEDTAMPPWGDMDITRYQTWVVITYIRTNFQNM